MAAGDIVNDGTLPYGSYDVTITHVTGASNDMVLKTGSPREGSNVITNEDKSGKQDGAVIVPQPEQGSGTLTWPAGAGSFVTPRVGSTFVEKTGAGIGFGNNTYIVTETGVELSNNGLRSISVSFRKKLNA